MRPSAPAGLFRFLVAAALLTTVGLGSVSAASIATTSPTSSALHVAVGSVRITTTATNARGHPTTSSKTLFVVSARTTVRVYRTATDPSHRVWYLVHVRSRPGWIAAWLTAPVVVHAAPLWHSALASSFGVGDGLIGNHMACGGVLTSTVMAVANRTLPCGSQVRIRIGSRTVVARVMDRGPYVSGRTFDLGPAVCRALGDCSGVFQIDWQTV